MKVQRFDKSQVRKILTAMIVDPVVLGRIAFKWEKGLFSDDWANLVGGWCVAYYLKYGKAPRKNIEGLFQSWSEDSADKVTVEVVEKLLTTLSGNYISTAKDINSEYMIDLALEHFNKVQVEKLIDVLQGGLDSGKIDKAYKHATAFGKIELGLSKRTNPLENKETQMQAFTELGKPLFLHKGALANFYEDAFARDTFVSYMGPEKRGKTWFLIDAAWLAMQQGRRVAFFEVGDMSERQINRRFYVRAARRPWKPQTFQCPLSIEHPDNADSLPVIEFEERSYKKWLDPKEAIAACKKIVKKAGKDLLRLWCYPNSTINMAGVLAELKMNERAGWIPDVVVIDYADLLAPMPGFAGDSQDQIDATWKAMRSLSQQFHCCMITATQSDAASYYAETLDRSHFSRDKRKFAHVTAMIGINQTKAEKKLGLFRLNELVLRESYYEEEKCIWLAGCLAIGNPALRSTF